MNNNNQEKKSVGEKIGSVIGQEIGKEIEKHVNGEKEKKRKKEKKPKSPLARRAGYIIAIGFSLVFLWVVSSLRSWGAEFLTDDWEQLLPLLQYSIYLSLAVHVLFIFYDQKLFYYLGKLAMDGFSIYVAMRMFQIFPFNFEKMWEMDWLNSVFPWIIILGIVGICIGIFVRTSRLISGKEIYD